MSAAERYLWAQREIGESRVVNSAGYSDFTAAPMVAGIERQAQPAIEVIGNAGAGAARIRFQAAAQGKQSQRKSAMHIGAGIVKRIPAVKLPLGKRLVLGHGQGAKRAQNSNRC